MAIPIETSTLQVLSIVFIATLIRSAVGFGEALIAVPLLAFIVPLKTAAPLAVLISATIAFVVVVQDWKRIHFRSTAWLVLSTLFGIPIGLMLLTNSHPKAFKAALAVLILAFSLYSLANRRSRELPRDSRRWLAVCGFLAGILGGAYGMNGPPLAVYGTLRRWTPQHFRATLQGYFLPASLVGLGGYWLAGLWTPLVNHYYLLSLPVVIPAIFIGKWINQRLPGEVFLKVVYAGLAAVGLVLFIQTFAAGA